MTANIHNISLLYRYLRLLSVQVDVGTVALLLPINGQQEGANFIVPSQSMLV